MNNGSKELQKQDNYSTSSTDKCDGLLASVEVHIQNSELNDETTQSRCIRGRLIKIE